MVAVKFPPQGGAAHEEVTGTVFTIDRADARLRIRYLCELVLDDPLAPCAGLAAVLICEEIAELRSVIGVR